MADVGGFESMVLLHLAYNESYAPTKIHGPCGSCSEINANYTAGTTSTATLTED